jgi:tripartite ATP-independent transporter DctM subunit
MTMEQFAPLMFLGLIIVMLIGFPVAFSLGALGLYCGFYAIEMGWFPVSFLNNLPLNIFGILSNELLLAIPFFTLMGSLLEKCGLAEDMLDSMGQLFGPVKGGLGYSVIIVGFILGAITGTVAGQVIAMAMISLPVMIRYGYDMRYATGVLAASGTITQLVPPSLVLVVMADQLGQSVGDMYKGAWGPSILQIVLFAIYTFILTRIRPHALPGVPPEARTLQGWSLWAKCLRGIIPSAVLIFAVLGSMGGLPGIDRHCHPDGSRRHGGIWCLCVGCHAQTPELAAGSRSHGRHDAHHRHGGVHLDRFACVLAGLSRGRRWPLDRAHAQ